LSQKPAKSKEPTAEEIAKLELEEQQILLEKAANDYQKLSKEDPRFLGIDLDTKSYWVLGNEFKIKQLGHNTKKQVSDIFNKHDSLAKEYAESIGPEDAAKRIGLIQEMDSLKDDVVELVVPLMLSDKSGSFSTDEWFSDKIPAATWWDVAKDLYLF